ncbi:MAG: potassium-transporting ATPase subunit KdpC [Acetobacteraceae bacterium]|nr:potassium-transporting ATPase subunit KdpC [Acetobacteraceae bacterium]
MREFLLPALRVSLVTWVLCGLVYPLAVTGLGQALLPFQANGSLEKQPDGTVVGSRLVGQQWDGPQWFHSRPSAIVVTDPSDPARSVSAPYNATNSGGSNLAPDSKVLSERLVADRKVLELTQPEVTGMMLPADMLTTSASGLDPDISPANALLQASRIARARGVAVEAIEDLVRRHIEMPSLGVFGEPRVNVLRLNLALQRTYPGR